MKNSTLKTKDLNKLVNKREADTEIYESEILSWLDSHNVPYYLFHSDGVLKEMDPDSFIIRTYPDICTGPLLVGKGVIYDSGGYNAKEDPSDMFHDKAGACLALYMSAKYGTPALVGFANNMIRDETRYLPGSIHRIGTKKVFISDSDAEGRVLLAYLLSMVDDMPCICLATLTGHASEFLGEGNGALVHTDNPDLRAALARHVGTEKLWPAPRYKSYRKLLRKNKKVGADIANWKGEADSMYAFEFLKSFRKDIVLVDMAAEMINDQGGYTGWGEDEMLMLLEHI